MNQTPNGATYTMIEYNNELYIGGSFQYQLHFPGPIQTQLRHIAKWNGISFDTLGSGMNTGGYVTEMIIYNGELIIAGDFSSANGLPANKIVKWNGSNFDTLGSRILGQKIMALAVFNGELYVGGIFTQAGNTPVHNIAKWNGTSWDSVGGGVSNQISDLKVYNGELYACGIINSAGGIPVNNIARWNGTNWNSVSGGINNSTVVQNMKVYSNELYVGGLFYQANFVNASCIAKWDGNNWTPLGAGVTSSGGVGNFEIYNGNLIVSGSFEEVDHLPALHIAKWDGVNWSTLGTGGEIYQPGSNVSVVYPFQGNLFISGTFQYLTSPSVTSYYMAKYYENPTDVTLINSRPAVIFYPNPTTDEITFTTKENGTLIVTNSLGQPIVTYFIKGKQTKILTDKFQTGIYFLTFKTDLGTWADKLVIQR